MRDVTIGGNWVKSTWELSELSQFFCKCKIISKLKVYWEKERGKNTVSDIRQFLQLERVKAFTQEKVKHWGSWCRTVAKWAQTVRAQRTYRCMWFTSKDCVNQSGLDRSVQRCGQIQNVPGRGTRVKGLKLVSSERKVSEHSQNQPRWNGVFSLELALLEVSVQSENVEPLLQKQKMAFSFLMFSLFLPLCLFFRFTIVFFICYLTSASLDMEILAGWAQAPADTEGLTLRSQHALHQYPGPHRIAKQRHGSGDWKPTPGGGEATGGKTMPELRLQAPAPCVCSIIPLEVTYKKQIER